MTVQNKHRRSIRLKHYDYAQSGFYFVTICCQHHLCLFGVIKQQSMYLNAAGEMIAEQWQVLTKRFNDINLHESVVMPNHFHGIIEIVGAPLVGAYAPPRVGQPQGIAPTLGDIIGAFKSLTTNAYIQGIKHNNWLPFHKKLWQRNYYEHIIRNDESYLKISEYIQTNPALWLDDKYYTEQEII